MSNEIDCELKRYMQKLEFLARRFQDPRARAVFEHGLQSIRAQLKEIDRDTSYLFHLTDKAEAEAEAN